MLNKREREERGKKGRGGREGEETRREGEKALSSFAQLVSKCEPVN